MNIQQEDFLRTYLEHYVSENIMLYEQSKDCDKKTEEEIKSQKECLTKKLLNNIEVVMKHM